MTNIALVTDSTSNMPESFITRHQIKMAHLVLIWGEKTLRDGIDITGAEFYQQLRTAEVLPTTSQPTVSEFIDIYKPLVEAGTKVVSVHISDKLSGTVHSAQQAKHTLPDADIAIIDSEMADAAAGLQVMAVARAIEAGMEYEDVVSFAEDAKNRGGAVFAVDTLEFLHRGGRIGGAKKFFGTALNIKPILHLLDGKIEALKQVRTKKLAHSQLLDEIEGRLEGRQDTHLVIMHSDAHEDAEDMLGKVMERFAPKEAFIQQINPVIGAHTGPGAVGIAYYSES
ncbi:MAG: DegV family protein [Anaerolineales bacterium]|nr:DegV family protein [Anaerolineales bacterium]